MSHRHDYQERQVTKHRGSKPGRPFTRTGVHLRRKMSPDLTGVVTASGQSGAFQVTYDEGTKLAGRSFWYNSYLAHTFLIIQDEEKEEADGGNLRDKSGG